MATNADSQRLEFLGKALDVRARVMQAIRAFFIQRDYLEVETPVRIPYPALELHIDAEPSGDRYLRTSPELHMKRLLAAGYDQIFQVGPCFRRGEQGDLHHPEYTMLEWYRAGADYLSILHETRELITFVARQVADSTDIHYGGTLIRLGDPWLEMSILEAFTKYAGWDPVASYDGDRFDRDLVEKIEPVLPGDRPCILADYPAPAAALARIKATDPRVAERWELYIGGLELANAYSELTDAAEQRARFEACAKTRERLGKDVYELDEDFLAMLDGGMPESGGIALGVDRLVMLFSDARSLDDVLPFRS